MPLLKYLRPTIAQLNTAVRNLEFRPWSVPLILLTLVVVSYGLRIRSLGFYWDDWPYLWFYHSLGPAGVANSLAEDRPFLSFIYILSLSTFGNSTVAWQVFGLAARWICSLGLWWMLSQAWPRSSQKVFWTAALFTVYPGFTQQWIVIIYSQAFILFSAVLFSQGITISLARKHQSISRLALGAGTTTALVLSAFTMFSTEYFFGLELLRPIFLWFVLNPQTRLDKRDFKALARRIVHVLKWWSPYLILMILFVIWRGFIHTFPGKSLTMVDRIGSAPITALGSLVMTMTGDFVEAAIASWGQAANPGMLTNWTSIADLRLPLLMLFVGAFVTIYMGRLQPIFKAHPQANQEHWTSEALIVGLLAFAAAGWPFWLTGLPMQLGFPQDRYSLPLAIGSCLLLAGLVDTIGRNTTVKAAMIGFLIALAVGFHVQVSQSYQKDWDNLRNLLWQMTWRAPQITPNTLFLTDNLGLKFYEDDSLSAPLNWTYDPDNQSQAMGYILYDLLVRQNSLRSLEPGMDVVREFRGKTFTGSTDQVLVIAYNPPGCLKILDPTYDSGLPGLPERVLRALPLSNPHQWVTGEAEPSTPPAVIFGEDPQQRWCYYYEKAALARQKGDWQEVVRLARDSIGRGIRPDRPQDRVEFLPFIEGYARVGLWDDAAQMTLDTVFWSPELQPALCSLWRRTAREAAGGEARERAIKQITTSLRCDIP